MKKSILIGVLAALMLFAFVACEQQMPVYKSADYIEINQVSDFIKGQDFDANWFSVTINFTDGSTKTVAGSGVVTEKDWSKYSVTATVKTVNGDMTQEFTATALDPESIVIDATTKPVTQVYVEATQNAPVKVEVKGATLVAGNAEWVLGADELAKVSVDDVVLIPAERMAAGAYTKNLVAEYDGQAIDTASTVVVNVVADPKNPADPSYEEPAKPLTKDDVQSLGVEWAITGDDESKSTSKSFTATVGDTVTYTIYGLSASGEKIELEDGDYEVVSGSIPSGTPLATDDITGYVDPDDEEAVAVKPFEATIKFVPATDKTTPNYGLDATIDLTLTVNDALTEETIEAVTASDFMYKPTEKDGVWTATEVPADKALTVKASDFIAIVETEGGKEVKLQGTELYRGEGSFDKEEVTAGSTLTVSFKWATADDTYGAYTGVAEDASITVVKGE